MWAGTQQTVWRQMGSSCPAHAMRQLEAAVLRGLSRTHQHPCLQHCREVGVHSVQQQHLQQPPSAYHRSSSRHVSCCVAVAATPNTSNADDYQWHEEQQQDQQEQQQQQRQDQMQQQRRKPGRTQQRHKQHAPQQTTLQQLLRTHLHGNLQQLSQQQQSTTRAKLARKLTSVLRDSTSTAADIADVLLVADSCCCLNAIHVAAALARLVRLADAQTAADAAATASAAAGGAEASVLAGSAAAGVYNGSGGDGNNFAVTAVVPLSWQEEKQMQLVSEAAAEAAVYMAADGSSSRWHTPAAFAAADAAAAMSAADGWQTAEHVGDEAALEFQQQQHLVEQLVAATVELWPSMSAATITSICWSLAHLQHEPPTELLQLAGAALADMAGSLQQQQQQVHQQQEQQGHSQDLSANPRQVLLLLWALAKVAADVDDVVAPRDKQQQQQGALATDIVSSRQLLQHVLSCLVTHMPDLSSQGLTLLCWAAATWSKNSSSSSSSSSSDATVPAAASEALMSATAAAMESQALTSRGLAVVIWSAARLGLTPDAAWLGAWFAAMHDALPAAGPQDLAVATWGLAYMGCPPPADWLAALSRRASAIAPYMSASELPALLWAFARLRYRPIVYATHALLQRGGQLATQGALSPQGLGILLYCAGVLGIELPGRWIDGVLAAAAGFLPLFRPAEASMLWVALVKLQHIPPTAWLDVWWAGSKGLLADAGGQQVVLMLWSSVKLGQGPPSHWMREWLAAAQGAMSRSDVTAQGYGLMWDALAQTVPTGIVPSSEWLSCYFTASQQPSVLARLDPLTVDKTLAGLAAVSGQLREGLDLPQDWRDSMLAASLRILQTANLVSVSNMLQAAGQLALPLPPVWLAAVMQRLQQLLGQAGVLLPPVRHSSSSSSSSNAGSVDEDTIGGVSSSGSSSSVGSAGTSAAGRKFVRSIRASGSAGTGRSMVLAARLERGFIKLCLQRVLYGLRAQQMLNPAAQRKVWYSAQQAAAGALPASAQAAPGGTIVATEVANGGSVVSGSDALAVWPWLASAVLAVWPRTESAQLALQVLALR